MDGPDPSRDVAAQTGRRLRRVAVIAGMTLVVLILIVVAIYAAVFLILAPMMA
jgi:hypothetical protein